MLDPNNPSAFESAYLKSLKAKNVINPYGSIVNGASNKNKFVYIPLTQHFLLLMLLIINGESLGKIMVILVLDPNASEDDESWWTPFIYLVVTPPMSADGGARTGWGYRISFLYS